MVCCKLYAGEGHQDKGYRIKADTSGKIGHCNLALVFSIIIFGYIGQTQGFIYAQF